MHIVRAAAWHHFADVRATISSADQYGRLTIFNIAHNKYRLIAAIHYNVGRVYARHVLTHKDYDLGRWKKDAFQKGTDHGQKPR